MKIAINGFGRIGRLVYRNLVNNTNLQVVAINDLTDAKTLAHLFQYDSVHGVFGQKAELADNFLTVGKQKTKLLSQRNIQELPWKAMGVDLVIECTGVFTKKEQAALHMSSGAKKVVISAPATDPDATFCMGINHLDYDPIKHHIISNASCTTNCLAPLALVLEKEYGIESGLMTTIHSYTNDQQILDLPHKDLRRARAAALSMIPTTTGAAKAIGLVLPNLKGKLDGFSIRVPTPNVSVVDFSAKLNKATDMASIISKFREYSKGSLKGILDICDEPLVSKDFNGNLFSSILDVEFCKMIDPKFVKLLAWYDNESGYSQRVIDLVAFIASKGV